MRTTVKDEWNMACPACGKDDRLSLTASIWVDLYPDGTLQSELNGNHEWDSSSACACGHCGWSGTVGDAHLDGPATADQEL